MCSLGGLGLSSVIYGLLYRPLTTPAIENEKKVSKADEEMVSLLTDNFGYQKK